MRTAVYVLKSIERREAYILQQKNRESCVYSPLKRRYKSRAHGTRHDPPTNRPPDEEINGVEIPTTSSTASFSGRLIEDGGNNPEISQIHKVALSTSSHPLYIDQLLEIRQSTGRTQNASFLLGVSLRIQIFIDIT